MSELLGVLIKAKERGLITSLKFEIEQLKTTNFRVSDTLIEKILAKYT